jgi:hypothetical protein
LNFGLKIDIGVVNQNKLNTMKKHINLLTALFLFMSFSSKAGNPYSTQKSPKLLKSQSPTVIVKDVPGLLITPYINEPVVAKKILETEVIAPLPSVSVEPKVKKAKSDPSISSSIYTPTAKELRKAKRIKKKLEKASPTAGGQKNVVVAILFCLFLGYFGIHRFYLGYTGIGLIQLFTLGFFGIWVLVDLILLLFGELKPKYGDFKKTLKEEVDSI